MIEDFEKREHKSTNWLLTFSDLVCLMLVFFVLLYSMSEIDQTKWKPVESVLQTSAENENRKDYIRPNQQFNVPKLRQVEGKNIDYLEKILKEQFQKSDMMIFGYIQKYPDRLVLSLPDDILFENNSDEIKDSSKKLLSTLVDTMMRLVNQIELIGHTDPRPIRLGAYESNWHLSLARALAIEQRFEELGYRKPIIVQGVADSEYSLLDQSIPEVKRQQMARKVDIVIHASKMAE